MAAVAMTATPVAMAAAHVSLGAPRAAVHLTSASGISATAAGQDAVAAVGGGAVTHTSADTYQGQSVWDVHVLYQGQVWDVKVGMTGNILLKKLSSEQPRNPSSSPPGGSTPAISAAQADVLAVQAVGGGTATHTSTDHAGGVAVYDIHVLYQNQVWDVKVNQTSGAIVQKQLSSEQPQSPPSSPASSQTPPAGTIPASQADALAIQAVGGGTATHTSTDQASGVAVYDIHVLYQNQVWDVKVNQTSGAIVQKQLSSEQPGSGSSGSSSNKTPEHQSESGGQSISTPPVGVVFGQKMSAAPNAFQSWVTQAISQVHGVSLKWVKFQAKSQGGYQMNIKIHLAQGTTKVIDVFNAQGQLVSQQVSN